MSNKINNGNRDIAWVQFCDLVAMALMKRGYYKNLADGRKFAEDLEMSFDALYEAVPRTEWARHINRDCVDYLKSVGRRDLVRGE